MKKISYILILLLVASSCTEFYEEDLSSLITSESGALTSETGLTAALAGSYKPYGWAFNMGFSNGSTMTVLSGSDDITTHHGSNKEAQREFDRFKVSNVSKHSDRIWRGCYKATQGANNILANYENATGNPEVINQIAGEAYFLRAYSYFWIVRLWGEAPLVLNSHIYDEELLTINSSPEADIYAQIVADLKMAESLMANKKVKPGRACKGTASAVLAEVYLTMAGWPINDASYYAKAAAKAKEVIDNKDTYGFDLVPNFADLWTSPTYNADNNKEEVFALNFAGRDGRNANAIVGKCARPGEMNGWDDFFCELTFFNEFPAGTRKDVTYLTSWPRGDGVIISWQQSATAHPYYKKFFGNEWSQISAISLPLERFAETYMVYAEAQVMATGNTSDPEALEAFNKIKRRGEGVPLNTPNAAVDATSITQHDIITEKGWEFAGEFCRWFDLVRLQMVQEVVDKKDPDDLQPIGPVVYYLPIPFSETSVNTNL
ncbi:MAG TPA: RagB/SusD family nutrient uptake outer membrane protein [Bacteroidales bacterium]|nr:RagB/SusD family nutrient uptake outer membrane protein [Bacteroidales bacterium]